MPTRRATDGIDTTPYLSERGANTQKQPQCITLALQGCQQPRYVDSSLQLHQQGAGATVDDAGKQSVPLDIVACAASSQSLLQPQLEVVSP